MAKLSREEQDELVEGYDPNTMDEDQLDAIYGQVDAVHQARLTEIVGDFADSAVGSDTWDSDD